MQAQTIRTETHLITSSQSLAAIQTLLRAGLGCITFLRNLLPDENFTESYFTAASGADASPDSSMSTTEQGQRRTVSGFKIMTMMRGYTEEADKIMNYLEYGIFDALQKQYLRSFIFAIYLDSQNPNNIVEAYTFNFYYHAIPGTDAVVPILTLGDDLRGMSLNQHKDPVAEAALKGKVPTLKEVKKSVKSLLKTLIHAMTQMDVLPKRRFATFKLFYTDKTPSNYEPPHFQAGDAERDKWYFMTHDLDDIPDRWSIGRVNAGYHSVNLSVASIATYLPSSTKLDNATFGGTTQLTSAASLTPEQEAHVRAQQTEEQLNDANDRNVAWAAEGDVELVDIDADGEDDPDYIKLPNGTYEKKPVAASVKNMVPFGMKNKDGIIEPLPMEVDSPEACYSGVLEVVPTKLTELADQHIVSEVDQTQSIDGSIQTTPATLVIEEKSSIERMTTGQLHGALSDFPSPTDSNCALGVSEVTSNGASTAHKLGETMTSNSAIDKALDCECGVATEDDTCFCEGGCGRWYHLWCMGYHSTNDNRMPAKFICFDCRLRVDLSWELIKGDLYPKIISKFRELALFRRAIKVAELKKPTTLIEFSKFFDSDHNLARQLFKRLEAEGFIFDQSTAVDDLGLTEVHAKNTRNKGRKKSKVAKRKVVRKSVFVFNRAARTSQAYENYFNPDPDVESCLLGVSDLKTCASTYPTTNNLSIGRHTKGDSQTQEETQLAALASLTLNQEPANRDDCDRPRKKVKISVATGVDLAE